MLLSSFLLFRLSTLAFFMSSVFFTSLVCQVDLTFYLGVLFLSGRRRRKPCILLSIFAQTNRFLLPSFLRHTSQTACDFVELLLRGVPPSPLFVFCTGLRFATFMWAGAALIFPRSVFCLDFAHSTDSNLWCLEDTHPVESQCPHVWCFGTLTW